MFQSKSSHRIVLEINLFFAYTTHSFYAPTINYKIMFKIVLIATVIGLGSAQLRAQLPPDHPHFSQVVRGNSVNDENGRFNYGYETSQGIRNDASGYVKNPEARSEDRILSIGGSYAYYTPDGALHEVTYTADENGFQPILKVTQG